MKITQDNLAKSKIQKIKAVNNKTIAADLSQWKAGEIQIWLVVTNGKNGVIEIEHVKKQLIKVQPNYGSRTYLIRAASK